MRKGAGWIQEKMNRSRAMEWSRPTHSLHGHKCADWNFGEEFARSVRRQPNAAVRCRIVRHIAGVHSKIETAQAHEIRHFDVVNGGTMVAFLVGDHKLAPLRRVARPTGGARRAIDRH